MKSSLKNVGGFFVPAQVGGVFGSSSGLKLHCSVGSVRNSTAAIMSVTSAQSAAVNDCPDGGTGAPVRAR